MKIVLFLRSVTVDLNYVAKLQNKARDTKGHTALQVLLTNTTAWCFCTASSMCCHATQIMQNALEHMWRAVNCPSRALTGFIHTKCLQVKGRVTFT